MGKKYIIELEDENYHQYSDSEPSDYLWRVKGFNALVFDEVGISKLTPYIEPDLEQVRKEAYDKGYADAKCGYENGFENGMIVAWDAAKKIALMDTETSENVTGYFGLFRIMENLTPMQAIEKIRQYEQEQEAEIKVGDEVDWMGDKYVVTYVRNEAKKADMISCKFGSACENVAFSALGKTGRHFPEIAEILEKMRNEPNVQIDT